MAEKRYSMAELKKLYPDKWVVLDDCEWENRSTVKSAVLIGVYDDSEISRIRTSFRHAGKKYTYERTSEGLLTPYVHAVNFEVKL